MKTSRVSSANPLVMLWNSVIGKKIVMAVTGAVLVLFVIAHMLGNLKVYGGQQTMNAYARFLREMGWPILGHEEGLWAVRIILLVCVVLHVTAATQLTRLSWQARPQEYHEWKGLASTFASRTMRWGGVLLLVFIVFHILHMTFGVVGFSPGQFKHLAVYQNVVAGFSVWPVSLFYIVAMVALGLHLDHGIWSAIQTLGFNSGRNEHVLKLVSRAIAVIVVLGFISVPVSVMVGWVR